MFNRKPLYLYGYSSWKNSLLFPLLFTYGITEGFYRPDWYYHEQLLSLFLDKFAKFPMILSIQDLYSRLIVNSSLVYTITFSDYPACFQKMQPLFSYRPTDSFG